MKSKLDEMFSNMSKLGDVMAESIDFLVSLFVRGKLIALPVSVGNIVYEFYHMDVKIDIKLYDGEVTHVCRAAKLRGYRLDENGMVMLLQGGKLDSLKEVPIEEFGNTVFSSEHEAIVKLSEIRQSKEDDN